MNTSIRFLILQCSYCYLPAARILNSLVGHMLGRLGESKHESINDIAPILKKTLGFGIWSLGVLWLSIMLI